MTRFVRLALGFAALSVVTACGASISHPATPVAATSAHSPTLQTSPSPQPSLTTEVPLTPQQRYINDLNAQYSDYASNLPDPNFGSNNESGTDAAILDEGAQLCEALASGGNSAAANLVSQYTTAGSGSDAETAGIIAFTKSVLCPKPALYQSKYQQYDEALKAAGVYSIVASGDQNGDPVQFGSIDICDGSPSIASWTQSISGSISQYQADRITQITRKYLCPGGAAAVTVPTVTYEATGSDIQYGPAGSLNSGYSGMHITNDIPNSVPDYYAISVTYGNCKITILDSDGSTVTSQESAPSGMANCELVNVGGSWYDANSGS